jgi:lipid-binding SYLF domain-containing protein
MKKLRLLVIGMVLCAATSFADEVSERLKAAATVMDEIMAAPDKGIPGDVLDKADCVAIIPGMKKAGFIVGGRYGRGAVSCRNKAQTAWEAPVMLALEGGSVGLQIGASSTDVVLLFMERSGLDSLMKDKVTLGGDASVAGGPVGRSATAQTDAMMKAKILSYSRSQGVFAGLELEGSTLRPDKDDNKALYGKPIEAKDILTGNPAIPSAAQPLIKALTKYSPKGK